MHKIMLNKWKQNKKNSSKPIHGLDLLKEKFLEKKKLSNNQAKSPMCKKFTTLELILKENSFSKGNHHLQLTSWTELDWVKIKRKILNLWIWSQMTFLFINWKKKPYKILSLKLSNSLNSMINSNNSILRNAD